MRTQSKGLRVLTTTGQRWVTGLSTTEASVVGAHWNAVDSYLGGWWDALDRFDGVHVSGHELETRGDVIEEQAMYGQVSFESIYESP
jgi:hypothetical protein